MGIVRIKTLTVPNNFVSLSMECWARLMSVHDKINAVIEDIKCYNPQFPSDYSGHIGDYYYVTVIGAYGRVDIQRFTIQMAILSTSYVLRSMELVSTSTSGHICYNSCRLFTNVIRCSQNRATRKYSEKTIG